MQLGLGLGLTCVQQAGGGGGEETPAWLEDFRAPSGDLPVVAADFVGGDYWDGSEEIALASLVTLAGTDTTRDANGLNIPATGDANPGLAAGALLAALATKSWTVVMEVLAPEVIYGLFLTLKPSAQSNDLLQIGLGGGDVLLLFEGDGGDAIIDMPGVEALSFGVVQRFAVTRTNDACALSLDGEAVVEGPSEATAYVVNFAYIGNSPASESPALYYIRSIAVYAPQPSAHLPTLSAP